MPYFGIFVKRNSFKQYSICFPFNKDILWLVYGLARTISITSFFKGEDIMYQLKPEEYNTNGNRVYLK